MVQYILYEWELIEFRGRLDRVRCYPNNAISLYASILQM